MGTVKDTFLFPQEKVAVFEAAEPGVGPVSWASANVGLVRDRLRTAGACLLRGFDVPDESVFAQVVRVFDDRLAEYSYGSTPRSKVGDVYTSTEYPAGEVIPQHNEMSYTTTWPLRIWFYSVVPARSGGETPLADSHAVYQRIPSDVRQRFEQHGVRYVRNYQPGLGLSWQDAFTTDDPAAVEEFCRERNIAFEWLDGGVLRTVEICQATATHPETGKPIWMNQAHLFHVSNLKDATRLALLDMMDEADLPRNAYLGDGRPIPEADLAAIRQAYDQEKLAFPWQAGDLLLVDNMAMSHGRSSFEGPRKLLVAMGAASYDNLPAVLAREAR
jgi:alpha-ketoglutarate-dependent taurine dioxygenase